DELLIAALVLHLHLDGEEGSVINLDNDLLYRGNKIRAAVGVLAENAREQFHEGFAAYGAILVKPCPVRPDAHTDVAAIWRVPILDGRELIAFSRLDKLV